MAKIRDLTLTDIPKLNKLMSFLETDAKSFLDGINLPFPFSLLNKICPMRLKIVPESYVLTDKNDILACISVKKFDGNHKKWKISKLFMSDNPFDTGLLLIQYVITKFAAKGVHTFIANVDDTQDEIIRIFVDGAGFRQCSRLQMWRYNDCVQKEYSLDGYQIRPFKNSDAQAVAELYNESILPHFRPSLSKHKCEFYENIFVGLMHNTEFRYVIEDKQRKQIVCYCILSTSDNKNYIMDGVISKGYENLFETILNYGYKQAQKRTADLNFFAINRYYMQSSTHIENVLRENSYSPMNSSAILVKDLFRIAKSENQVKQVVFYNDINSNPAFDKL
ncbi:hypothetical protein IJE86_07335 [bacterium]|nr:hypothetical protein [bacterium]